MIAYLSKLNFRPSNLRIWYRFIGSATNAEAEYTDVPVYPPIESFSFEYKHKKRRIDWYSKIEKLPTVEQKIIELNMPKYYGYWSVILKDQTIKPVSLDFIKFATRTKVTKTLPMNYYEGYEENVSKAVDSIKEPVKDLIRLHFSGQICRNRKNKLKEEKIKTENFIIDLNNLIMKSLKEDAELSPASVDLRPRIEGFWFVGGFENAAFIKKRYEKVDYLKCLADLPTDRTFRSSLNPALALRMGKMLPELLPIDATPDHPLLSVPTEKSVDQAVEFVPLEGTLDEVLPSEGKGSADTDAHSEEEVQIKPYETDPKFWGLMSRRRRACIVPGFWPGVKDEHSLLFFHTREHQNNLENVYGVHASEVKARMLQLKQIIAGFTQTLSYSLYQGFTPVNEVTYPFMSQSVCTDGRSWQFGLYQLNTCALHSELSVKNPRTNFLWLSDDMKLFEEIDGSSVEGFNEDVLKILCSMYLKKGVTRQDPHPYLADYKYLMHHEAPEEYKEEFLKVVRNILSERPPNHKIPEIDPWEFIYKIKFKTRHMDKKIKFFENRWVMNPYRRRLDEYKVPYIPRVRRLHRKIKFKPRINSEHLFKHDWHTIKRIVLYDDDEIAFKTMNINKDTPPYYTGLKWSNKGDLNIKPKI